VPAGLLGPSSGSQPTVTACYTSAKCPQNMWIQLKIIWQWASQSRCISRRSTGGTTAGLLLDNLFLPSHLVVVVLMFLAVTTIPKSHQYVCNLEARACADPRCGPCPAGYCQLCIAPEAAWRLILHQVLCCFAGRRWQSSWLPVLSNS